MGGGRLIPQLVGWGMWWGEAGGGCSPRHGGLSPTTLLLLAAGCRLAARSERGTAEQAASPPARGPGPARLRLLCRCLLSLRWARLGPGWASDVTHVDTVSCAALEKKMASRQGREELIKQGLLEMMEQGKWGRALGAEVTSSPAAREAPQDRMGVRGDRWPDVGFAASEVGDLPQSRGLRTAEDPLGSRRAGPGHREAHPVLGVSGGRVRRGSRLLWLLSSGRGGF